MGEKDFDSITVRRDGTVAGHIKGTPEKVQKKLEDMQRRHGGETPVKKIIEEQTKKEAGVSDN